MKKRFNRPTPAAARTALTRQVASVVEKIAAPGKPVADPSVGASHGVTRVGPVMLPFELGNDAAFTVPGFNDRALDDAMEVMLSLPTDAAFSDGAAPSVQQTR